MTQATLAKYVVPLAVVLLASLGANAYQATQYSSVTKKLAITEMEFASSTTDFQTKLNSLQTDLTQVLEQNDELENDLEKEKDRNDEFEDQIDDIADKVGELDKLSKTDPQLLQKYSKVYFLNEHYTPVRLADIDPEYLSDPTNAKQIHASVKPFLENLMEAAVDDEIDLKILSAYRSFGEQTSLKAGYKFTYGAGTANQFSADQGYSEHQLGTTVDFTTVALKGGLSGFDKTPAYAWLLEHASEYGFTLSYPETNSYYEFEPWHWRFVGIALAKKLQHDNNHFYDLDQRVLNTHLVNLFERR